jgi:hypothetical protein
MDKWLKMGSVKKARENEISTSVMCCAGLACDKLNLCDQSQSGVGKLCQEGKV